MAEYRWRRAIVIMGLMEFHYELSERAIVLLEGLRDAHPMSECLTSSRGSRSARHLSVDGEGSDIALRAVVVGGDVGVIEKGEHPVKVLVKAGLKAGDVRVGLEHGVGDEPAHPDSYSSASGEVSVMMSSESP